jgi:hypothetical protein
MVVEPSPRGKQGRAMVLLQERYVEADGILFRDCLQPCAGSSRWLPTSSNELRDDQRRLE